MKSLEIVDTTEFREKVDSIMTSLIPSRLLKKKKSQVDVEDNN
jgi:hypothetical protein